MGDRPWERPQVLETAARSFDDVVLCQLNEGRPSRIAARTAPSMARSCANGRPRLLKERWLPSFELCSAARRLNLGERSSCGASR